jgi:hypothetical protein
LVGNAHPTYISKIRYYFYILSKITNIEVSLY